MNFRKILMEWYQENRRDLPWRRTCDPYKIWLSEIILQQTRVNQGMPYYNKFTHTFPDINALANAPEDQVLKLWQGLGYYSRARNLLHTAKHIRDNYNGIFPSDPAIIASLKGIGEYTTAAISSFAFGIPIAVIDGNVVRVLSRFFNVNMPFDSSTGKKIFRKIAISNLDKTDPGSYNQAIMEFGAMQCKPVNPDCLNCPLQSGCSAFKRGMVDQLPVRKKQVRVKKRNFNYIINKDNSNLLIRKRIEKDIWQNLYEFPLIESAKKLTNKKLSEQLKSEVSLAATYVHRLSHLEINARFWIVNDLKVTYLPETQIFLSTHADNLNKYPVSRLMEKFISEKMS